MKESSWEECTQTNAALSISPDTAKAKSLIDTSIGRISYLQSNTMNEANANYIFEGYYMSLLEFLHAILYKEGYKVLNHICVGFYVRDVLKSDNLYRLFDDCRYKRNSLIYYGRQMDFETAKDAINKAKELIKEVRKMINT